MARAGLVDILAELRGMTDTAENQYTVGGVYYWSSDQLQLKLDQHRSDVVDLMLVSVPMMVAGVQSWTRYYIPEQAGRPIESDLTTGAFEVVDSLGNAAPSYTVDLVAGLVTFTANTTGLEYFIRCRSFDIRAVAAQIWFEKAGHRAELIEWKAGGHTLKEDIEWQHCMDMYSAYSRFQGIGVVRLLRRGYSRWV